MAPAAGNSRIGGRPATTGEIVRRLSWVLVALVLVAVGCEPASITDARNQLGRSGVDTIQISLPIAQDTFDLSKFDLPGDTVINDLRAIAFDPESVKVAVGDKLQFQNVAFSQFVFSYDQMLRTAEVGTSFTLPFAPPSVAQGIQAPAQAPGDTILRFATPAGSQVVGATVDTGTAVRSLTNGTGCPARVTMALSDSSGNSVAAFATDTVPVGGTVSDSVRVDGAVVTDYVTVTLGVTPLSCAPAPGTAVSAQVTFRPMTLTAVDLQNVSESFTDSYDPFTDEPRVQAVDTIGVASGSFTITAQNRLPIALRVDLTLHGILNGSGQPLVGTLSLPAAPGNGSTTSGALVFDLAGTRIIPGSASIEVDGSATAPSATITSLVTDQAVIADGSGSAQVSYLEGELDPAVTPELVVGAESSQEIDSAAVDFGDLSDAIKGSTINTAVADLTVRNATQTPFALSSFTLGVVTLTPTGQIPRDGLGNPVYETDVPGGAPILIPVTDPGQATLSVGRTATKAVTLAVGPLVDRVVHLLLDGKRAAVIAAGTVTAGDGQTSRLQRADSIPMDIGLLVGLDVTLPDTGVEFTTENSYQEGLKLKNQSDIDDFVSHIVSAAATAVVQNGTAFGVQVELAYVADSVASGDVFQQSNVVLLAPVSVAASQVDANGRVVQAAIDTTGLVLTGDQLRPLLGERFTAALRVRLLPGEGGGGRSALGATDRIIVRAGVNAAVERGGGQ
jgi:hypothetical protein